MPSSILARTGALLLVCVLVPACKNTVPVSGASGTTTAAVLTGSQVVPALSTIANGFASVFVEEGGNRIRYTVSASGLGTVTSVRIHLGDPGTNGPPLFTLSFGPFANPLTGTLGEGDLLPAAGVSTFGGAGLAILSGQTYMLISTSGNPEGEIRGQIGPATVASARMSGAQVVSPVATAATGTATFALSPAQDRIDVTLTFTGFATGDLARVRLANAGATGPTLFDLATAPFSSPLTVSLVAGNMFQVGGFTTFAEGVNALLSGQLYVDVTTGTNPGGEIRGQIGPVRLTAALTGGAVFPANSSTATGTASVALNGLQTGLTVGLTHSVSAPTGVLIHADVPGSNGPLIFTVAPNAASSASPLEVFLGAGTLVEAPSKSIGTFPDATDALITGQTYIEVTSTGFPSGEIRGQITP